MNYKIGEFSRITCMTIKTLRYYHEINLLVPPIIDDETGYRYYNEDSYELAKIIQLLKHFEFSINEIQEILSQYEDEDDLKAYLLEQKNRFNQKINHYQNLQTEIDQYKPYKEVLKMSNQTIEKLQVDDLLVASITYVGRYDEIGVYLGKLFNTVKMNVNGKPFTIYHDDEFKADDATVEVCIPLKKDLNYKDVETKVLSGGSAIKLLHIGSYETLSESYKQMTDYIKENEIPVKSFRECYIKGPGMLLKGNPNKYKTELLVVY